MEYPSNSFKSKETSAAEQVQEKKNPVVMNTAKVRPKSEIRKFSEMLFKQDAEGVKRYVISEWLIPGIQKGILGLLQTMFYGANTQANTNLPTMAGRVSYCNYSKPAQTTPAFSAPAAGYNWPDIIYATRGDAESVYARMQEIVRTYRMVKVGDMYDLSGVSAPYTSYNYAWSNIDSARITQNMDGTWRIVMPRACPVE